MRSVPGRRNAPECGQKRPILNAFATAAGKPPSVADKTQAYISLSEEVLCHKYDWKKSSLANRTLGICVAARNSLGVDVSFEYGRDNAVTRRESLNSMSSGTKSRKVAITRRLR